MGRGHHHHRELKTAAIDWVGSGLPSVLVWLQKAGRKCKSTRVRRTPCSKLFQQSRPDSDGTTQPSWSLPIVVLAPKPVIDIPKPKPKPVIVVSAPKPVIDILLERLVMRMLILRFLAISTQQKT